jgi:hypothetical protein
VGTELPCLYASGTIACGGVARVIRDEFVEGKPMVQILGPDGTEVNGLCPMLDGRAPRESREELLKRLLQERRADRPR